MINSAAVMAKIEQFYTFEEIEALVKNFEACKLPHEKWTHRAHITVAFWYLICYSEAEATTRIRDGIKRYNAAKGIQTTKDRGYHETMTLFWIRTVKHYLNRTTLERPLAHLVNDLVENHASRGLPFEFYSRDRLLSWEARLNWVEPDLKPFPGGNQQEIGVSNGVS